MKAFFKNNWGWLAAAIAVLVLLGVVAWATFTFNVAQVSTLFTGILAIGVLMTAGAIIAAFAQARTAEALLQDTRQWNRMSFALTYLPKFDSVLAIEKELDASFIRFISRNGPLSHSEVEELLKPENAEIHLKVRAYLNMLEAYCVAINCGLADEKVAKLFYAFKLVCHYNEFKPYIEHQRALARDRELFSELEKVANKWSEVVAGHQFRYGEGH